MPRRKKAPRRADRRPRRNVEPWAAAGLTPTQYGFALEYLQNGFNARQAYREIHRRAGLGTAGVEGYRTLNLPKVRSFLNAQLEGAWKPLQMGGEQALARIARIAAFDIRDLHDKNGELLPVDLWPDAVVGVVRGIQHTDDGVRVQLESPHAALRTILEQTGKLRTPGDSIDALAEAIRGDLAKHGRTGEP